MIKLAINIYSGMIWVKFDCKANLYLITISIHRKCVFLSKIFALAKITARRSAATIVFIHPSQQHHLEGLHCAQ